MVKWSALIVSFLTFLLSIYLLLNYDAKTPVFQWVEKMVWIERFGIHYFFVFVVISLLLVMMTTFITVIFILASWTETSTG